MLGRLRGLGAEQLCIEPDRAPFRDLVLYAQLIAGIAVEPLRPKMRVGPGIDQPGINPNMIG
jgi:hypothetical protein